MSLKYLLDTNVISEPLRPNPSTKVLRRMRTHQSDVAISAIVWHELQFGCQRLPPSAKRTAIETYLANVVAMSLPILPYEENAAAWHAAERARLTKLGKTPPFVDGQIAAIAHAHNLILVTRNTNDYAEFQGLRLEDWHK